MSGMRIFLDYLTVFVNFCHRYASCSALGTAWRLQTMTPCVKLIAAIVTPFKIAYTIVELIAVLVVYLHEMRILIRNERFCYKNVNKFLHTFLVPVKRYLQISLTDDIASQFLFFGCQKSLAVSYLARQAHYPTIARNCISGEIGDRLRRMRFVHCPALYRLCHPLL